MSLAKEMLNDDQIEKLIKYLKQIKYSKSNLVEDILDSTVTIFPDGDSFKKSEEKLENLIRGISKYHDYNWIISLLSSHIHEQYDKTISQGQVQAILKRILGISLSSTERSQLHELRKKIQRYEKFINNFSVWGKKYDFPLKIIMFGLNREKSNEVLYLLNKSKIDTDNIIGVDFYTYILELADKFLVQLQIWHLSNDKRFEFLRKQYIRGVTGVVLFFDKSNRESFDKVKDLILLIKKQTNLKVKLKQRKDIVIDLPISIVGITPTEKSELKTISMEEIYALTNDIGANYSEVIETSEFPIVEALQFLSYEILIRSK